MVYSSHTSFAASIYWPDGRVLIVLGE